MSAEPKVVLYYDPFGLFARIVVALIKYHKLPVELRVVELSKGQHLEPSFIAINPHHTVPTLVNETDNVTIVESSAIILYLGQLYNLTGKYGYGTTQASQARTLNAIISNNHHIVGQIYPNTCRQIASHAIRDTPFNLDELKTNAIKLHDELVMLSNTIEQNNGTITGEYTIADVQAAIVINFVLTTELGLGLVDISKYHVLQKWHNEVIADVWLHDDFDTSCKTMSSLVKSKIPESRLGEQ